MSQRPVRHSLSGFDRVEFQRHTRTDREERFERNVVVTLRYMMALVITPLTVVIDFVYDTFDLWRDRVKREPDHAKVRGFVLYNAVWVTMLVVAIRAETVGSMFFVALMAILALAAGERVLVSFFKAWSRVKMNGHDKPEITLPVVPTDPREPDSRVDDESGS